MLPQIIPASTDEWNRALKVKLHYSYKAYAITALGMWLAPLGFLFLEQSDNRYLLFANPIHALVAIEEGIHILIDQLEKMPIPMLPIMSHL